MQEADSSQFATTMRGVFALYRADLSEAVLAIWWNAMKAFDLAAVKDALNRHAVDPDQGRFLPKPADVVKLIGGSTKDAALLGWSKVQRAIGTVGGYETVCFDDPIINAVIYDMGGWVDLCMVGTDEMPFKGNEFVTRYQGYRAKGNLEGWPAKLLGRADMGNAQKGFSQQEPVLIGNQTRALKVLREGGTSTLQVGHAGEAALAIADKMQRAA
jgi:hypothetical protein